MRILKSYALCSTTNGRHVDTRTSCLAPTTWRLDRHGQVMILGIRAQRTTMEIQQRPTEKKHGPTLSAIQVGNDHRLDAVRYLQSWLQSWHVSHIVDKTSFTEPSHREPFIFTYIHLRDGWSFFLDLLRSHKSDFELLSTSWGRGKCPVDLQHAVFLYYGPRITKYKGVWCSPLQ